jgi:hypothetical protein
VNYADDPHKRFLLANINYYRSLNTFALEVSPGDMMPQDQILFLHKKVSESTFIGDSLHFLLNSSRLQQEKNTFSKLVPLLDPGEIYGNLDYQAIGKYQGYGVLRFVNDLDASMDQLNPMDIIVLNKTPESAFVIPFYFYDQHVKNSGVYELINELLENDSLAADHDDLRERLRLIRDSLIKAPLDSSLLKLVKDKIQTEGDYERMRFRSSTNAEDARGFFGAGLYNSRTGILYQEWARYPLINI